MNLLSNICAVFTQLLVWFGCIECLNELDTLVPGLKAPNVHRGIRELHKRVTDTIGKSQNHVVRRQCFSAESAGGYSKSDEGHVRYRDDVRYDIVGRSRGTMRRTV